MSVEVSWFSALCDDDYRFLGVPDTALASSWQHCRDITVTADRLGYDGILLPSGYQLGIDSVAFAGGIAPLTQQIRLLVAVRCGEMWVPQLARQLATLDQMSGGRLAINIISSDLPGAPMASVPRYQRTRETMICLSQLLSGQSVEFKGEFINLELEAPKAQPHAGQCPPLYFGGLSEPARQVAAECADVFLMWPDTEDAVAALLQDMSSRADTFQRTLKYGYRAHVIVRESEGQAMDAARLLVSELDDEKGNMIRNKSLDTASVGVNAQSALRLRADADGFAEEHLWTGVGRARSGCGAAIVGDPDQVLAKLLSYQKMGIEAFILSGYPHLEECDLLARYVLPRMDHKKLTLTQLVTRHKSVNLCLMKQALILYATREGQTKKVALALAQHFVDLGSAATVHNLQDSIETADLQNADLLLFGASMHAGGLERELVDFINDQATSITRRPHAFFLVLLSAATADQDLREKSLSDAQNKVQQQLNVEFDDMEYIAGALRYSKYSRPVRWVMRRIAQQHGENTDTSRDYEYTDWATVKTYAERLHNAYLAANQHGF